MSDVYPGIDDWDQEVRQLLPSPALAGDGEALWLGLFRPLADLEIGVESLVRELADIEIAGMYVARTQCLRYGIEPGGMPVHELRRLAAGGAAALACDASNARQWTMWTALTGDPSALVRPHRSGASYSAVFTARLAWLPSAQWNAWAGRLVSRCLEAGSEGEARYHVGGALVLDGGPALDAGTLAYSLPVTW